MKWQDKISKDINEIKVTLASQHESLKSHMKRTSMLEERFKPIEEGFMTLKAIQKLLGLLALLFAILESAKIIHFF